MQPAVEMIKLRTNVVEILWEDYVGSRQHSGCVQRQAHRFACPGWTDRHGFVAGIGFSWPMGDAGFRFRLPLAKSRKGVAA